MSKVSKAESDFVKKLLIVNEVATPDVIEGTYINDDKDDAVRELLKIVEVLELEAIEGLFTDDDDDDELLGYVEDLKERIKSRTDY